MRGTSITSVVFRSTLCLASILAPLLIHPTAARSQQITASITGTVSDPSGAPIPGAAVVATDLERGNQINTKTDALGAYALSQVPVSSYSVRVAATGFTSAVQSDVVLVLNQTARLDFKLQVGAISQTVEVTSGAPQLQTETTEVSTVINSQTISDLPLASRNYVQLTLLAPGATTPSPAGFTNGITTGLGPGGNDASRPYINGNHEQANNFLLDGMDNNQVSDNLVGYTPNSDAIEEFNLITNNASAEFGNYEGGIINATIKSGTNHYHGEAFEFFRNDALNANSWSNNWQDLPKAPLRWNQYGGTFGGPIIKDKLFFFTDYQGQRFDTPPSVNSTTVMTAAERNGDFSQVLSLANPIQLKNPFDGMPFPNNQIPLSLEDNVAKNLFASGKYPLPANSNLVNNYYTSNGTQINQDQGDVKVDWNLTNSDRLYVRYSRLFANDPTTNNFPLSDNQYTNDNAHNGVINWTHTFSPNIINEFRFGVNYILVNNGYAPQSGLGDFGTMLGIANANIAGPGLLALNFTGNEFASSLGSSIVGNQQLFASTVGEIDDTAVITRGRHTIHAGFQFFRERINVYYAGNAGNLGSLSFDGQYSGLAEADFFLGLPSGFAGGSAQTGTWGQRSNIIAGFVQDNYRVSKSLTLNLGLRYETHTPWEEVDNRQANFGLFSGTEYIAGQSCPYSNCKALYNDYNGILNWQPRIGFAYSVGDKTVIRGAYSLSSYLEGTGTNLRLPMNPPFQQPNFSVSYSTASGLPATTTDQGLIPPPPGNPFQGAEIRLWDPNVRPAAAQQWNLSVQRQLTKNMTLQAGYVGQHNTGLMQPMLYSEGILNSNGTVSPGPYLAGNPTLKDEVGVVAGTSPAGSQEYNSLQATLQQRFQNGLQFQVAYTYSKCMTNNGGYYGTWSNTQAWFGPTYWQNVYDSRAEWGPCFFDNTHDLTTYALYQLPFGKGRQFGSNSNAFVNAVAGGWNVSTIITAKTGFPMTPYTWDEVAGVGLTNVFPYRVNCVSPAQIENTPYSNGAGSGGIQWFNPAAFALPASGTFGNCGNGVVRGPGFGNIDISLMKDFAVTETMKVQFRADFVNATNSVQLNSPNLGCNTASGSSLCDGGGTGVITSAQNPRNIQLGFKFIF
jgi:hypothetical protein